MERICSHALVQICAYVQIPCYIYMLGTSRPVASLAGKKSPSVARIMVQRRVAQLSVTCGTVSDCDEKQVFSCITCDGQLYKAGSYVITMNMKKAQDASAPIRSYPASW